MIIIPLRVGERTASNDTEAPKTIYALASGLFCALSDSVYVQAQMIKMPFDVQLQERYWRPGGDAPADGINAPESNPNTTERFST